jgi:hypothetical protein
MSAAGDSEQDTEALETKLGRKFAGIRKNYGPDNKPTISPEILNALARGRSRFIYQNGKPNVIKPDTNTSGTFWKSGAAGHYDTIFVTLWDAVTKSGNWTTNRPFYYSPHHEQTTLSEAPGGKNAGTPADFTAFFKHIHDLCVSRGYHISKGGCVALCLVPDANQLIKDPKYGSGKPNATVAPYQISKIDPGPQYYDLAGGDLYVKSTTGTSITTMFTALHNWAKAVGKPFMTGETGIASNKNPASQLAQLDKALKGFGAGTGPGQVFAICWTSRVAAVGGDYRMDSSPTTLAAFKKLALDPFYSA